MIFIILLTMNTFRILMKPYSGLTMPAYLLESGQDIYNWKFCNYPENQNWI